MRYLITTLVLGLSTAGFSQSADLYLIGSLGGDFSNATIDVNYSAGEAMIETVSTANLIVTQGFHQPIMLDESALSEISADSQMSLYPNPVNSQLNIKISDYQNGSGNLGVQVIDAFGKLLLSDELVIGNDGEMFLQVNVSDLEPGHYHVLVVSEAGITARSKFIKL